MKLLDDIKTENDIKKIDEADLPELCKEIREFLIEHVSQTGGHIASNLGCVELTVALHRCLDFPKDKLIWDVGHQSYVHKLLTGRREGFDRLRQFGGMSGFPKSCESDCDAFNTGHSSTSLSAALGMACAKNIKGTDEKIVAVIGDGSFTGGMVYEAINNMAGLKTGCLIVLNDNEMSIDENVGGMSRYLNRLRIGQGYNELKSNVEKALYQMGEPGEKIARKIKKSKDSVKQLLVPGMFFEDLGLTYVGPVDGHNIKVMEDVFSRALKLNKPILVHVKTKKGKGYRYAEKYPSYFHGIAPFNMETGKVINKPAHASNTVVFSRKITALAENDDRIVAITAAMAKGTGLDRFAAKYPDRFFDVGIAEEHAVTFAAGLAKSGMIPVVAVYSSFLQRAYDQIVHDVCLQGLHVIFAIDRSGLVGEDGDTHQGIFDIAYLMHIPHMTILAPKNRYELDMAIEYAVSFDGPIAIKYSRGMASMIFRDKKEPFAYGRSEYIYRGSGTAILAVGNMMDEADELTIKLETAGVKPTLINSRFLKPIDCDMIDEVVKIHDTLVIMEEGIKQGGYGSAVEGYISEKGYNIRIIHAAIDDTFVEHGSIGSLRSKYGIDAESVYQRIMK